MTSKELTLVERAAVALGTAEHEKALVALVAQSATITLIKNNAGREQCHGALMTLKSARVSIEKAGKTAREDATQFSKAVIAEEKRLVAITQAEEIRLQEIRDAWDEAREAEKQAKLHAEAQRVAAIRELIEEIRRMPGACPGKTSAELLEHAEDLARQPITLELFEELSGEAEVVRETAVEQLHLMAKLAFDREQEKARIAEERAELERLRAEQEERDRVAAVARAEYDKRVAAERAEQEAKDRERRDAEEAARRVALDKADVIMRTEREAHEKRMAAERAEMQRQQDEAAAEQRRRQKEIDAEQAAARVELQREQDALAAQRRAEADEAAAKQRKHDLAAAKMLRDQQELAERERIAREAADTAVRNAAPQLLIALEKMVDWAANVSDEYIDGEPGLRAEYAADMKIARSALKLANETESLFA